MAKKQDDTLTKESFFKAEVIQGSLVVLVIVYFIMNSGVKNFLVTREEGDTMKERVTKVEIGMNQISQDIKENQKETEAKINATRTELKQDIKSSQDVILGRLSEITERLFKRIDVQASDLREQMRDERARERLRSPK